MDWPATGRHCTIAGVSDRTFIPGLELSRLLYEEAVRPILSRDFPALRYTAALIGDGSDVLGFDTEQSTDHGWGPRLRLFLAATDFASAAASLDAVLHQELPAAIAGYPIDMAWSGVPDAPPQPAGGRRHRVEIDEPFAFFRRQLGRETTGALAAVDWLMIPQQTLLSVTAGAVFHDGLNTLAPLRARLRYYPRDVWLYMMAAQWRRVAQEEAFMGRCAQVGDEIGSRLVAARLVDEMVHLAFLLEQTYAPYRKWVGTAFRQLAVAKELEPALLAVLSAATWPEREAALVTCWRLVAEAHNALDVTPPLPVEATGYYDRPYLVIHAEWFEEALLQAIEDPAVRVLPRYLGSVDQMLDTADLLSAPGRLGPLAALYNPPASER